MMYTEIPRLNERLYNRWFDLRHECSQKVDSFLSKEVLGVINSQGLDGWDGVWDSDELCLDTLDTFFLVAPQV